MRECVFCICPAAAEVAIENPRGAIVAFWPMCSHHMLDHDAIKSVVYYSAELCLN